MTRPSNATLARYTVATAIVLGAVATTAQTVSQAITGRAWSHASVSRSLYVGARHDYVIVQGDGDTDLDCALYNPDGRVVSRDTRPDDICVLRAPDTGTHRVTISNLGDVFNDYVIRAH
jgi:hypothetical protein